VSDKRRRRTKSAKGSFAGRQAAVKTSEPILEVAHEGAADTADPATAGLEEKEKTGEFLELAGGRNRFYESLFKVMSFGTIFKL
jgi:hypothetical protein